MPPPLPVRVARRRPARPAGPQRVLVTGAASGLGLALARRYLARGDVVVATDLGDTAPAELAGTAVDWRRLDVRSEEQWLAARGHVEEAYGGLDLLVNNAGVAAGGRIELTTEAEWARLVEVNLLGVARGCRIFAPLFLRQGHGRIVNVASAAGLCHAPYMAPYNATKAAVVALSETLSHELGRHGVGVTVVCPFFFESNLAASLAGLDVEAERAAERLFTRARHTADEVAGHVVAGVDAGRDVVLVHPMTRVAWFGKRLARPLYRRVMSSGRLTPGVRR